MKFNFVDVRLTIQDIRQKLRETIKSFPHLKDELYYKLFRPAGRTSERISAFVRNKIWDSSL